MVRDLISTSTLLQIAHFGCIQYGTLRLLYVRQNALILKSDWPKSLEWTQEFSSWLHATSKSYSKTTEEIRKMFGWEDRFWSPLTDKEFKDLQLNVKY